MEKVYVIAVKSFINAITGTVTKKQKLLLSENLAKEFVSMGLVVYESKKLEVPVSPPASETTDGTETPSVSLPAETASPTTTSTPPKRGRGRRAGR